MGGNLKEAEDNSNGSNVPSDEGVREGVRLCALVLRLDYDDLVLY